MSKTSWESEYEITLIINHAPNKSILLLTKYTTKNAQAEIHLNGSRGPFVVQASTVDVHADLSHYITIPPRPRRKRKYCGR